MIFVDEMTQDRHMEIIVKMLDCIKQEAAFQGIRKKNIAENIGVTPGALSQMLKPGNNPKLGTILAIMEQVGLTLVVQRLPIMPGGEK